MSGTVYKDVYDFSTNTSRGFLAVLTCLDENLQPYDIHSAEMLVSRPGNLPEFIWNTTNGKITLGSGGSLTINVATTDLMPKTWINVSEQYPHQIYNYIISTYNLQVALIFSMSGAFTIYNF